MKRKRWQYTVRLLLLLMLAVAIGSYWFRPRKVIVEYRIDRLEALADHLGGTDLVVYVQVSNKSSDSIWYRGVGSSQPDYTVYEEVEEELSSSKHSTEPSQWVKFPGKTSFEFQVPISQDVSSMQVAIAFATTRGGRRREIWSEKMKTEHSGVTPKPAAN